MNSESVELYLVKERANSVGKLRCQHSNGETLSKANWQPNHTEWMILRFGKMYKLWMKKLKLVYKRKIVVYNKSRSNYRYILKLFHSSPNFYFSNVGL